MVGIAVPQVGTLEFGTSGSAGQIDRTTGAALPLPPGPAPPPPGVAGPATVVTPVTGPSSPDRTDRRWHVYGADLGHLIEYADGLYMVFGDTFGPELVDWRSNSLARVERVGREGIRLAGFQAAPNGHATELLPSKKVVEEEMTVIPTAGIAEGSRLFLHYLSVRSWGPAHGQWKPNFAGLAYSDDGGATWTRPPTPRWPAQSSFGQVAFVRHEDYIYLLGTPAGRFGGMRVARVWPSDLLDASAYRYWDGLEWVPEPSAAALVIPPAVGELSVRWNEHLRAWLVAYYDEARDAIIFRAANHLTGPWSDATIVATKATFPGLYAPFLVPGLSEGSEVHFTMSMYHESDKNPYQVYLVRVPLAATSASSVS
ncbi:MAG: DUF4185 domain-containing protein [Nitriliruptorales bacterium]